MLVMPGTCTVVPGFELNSVTIFTEAYAERWKMVRLRDARSDIRFRLERKDLLVPGFMVLVCPLSLLMSTIQYK